MPSAPQEKRREAQQHDGNCEIAAAGIDLHALLLLPHAERGDDLAHRAVLAIDQFSKLTGAAAFDGDAFGLHREPELIAFHSLRKRLFKDCDAVGWYPLGTNDPMPQVRRGLRNAQLG